MFRCFISYRRQSAWAVARVIETEVNRKFGDGSTFLDIDNIPKGEKFPEIIERKLKESDVIFVAIDEYWLVDKHNQRRLENPEDWVRREIEIALKEQIPIIPLLIGDARMPSGKDVPESLREFVYFEFVRLRNEEFHTDLKNILQEVETRVALERKAQTALDSINGIWGKGSWIQCHERLNSVCAKWQQLEGDRQVPQLQRRLNCLKQLTKAAEAFNSHDFETARDLLEKVKERFPVRDMPPNVEWSLKFAQIGASAISASEQASLRAAETHYTQIKREVIAQEFDVPGLIEVGSLFSTGQTEAKFSYQRAVEAYRAGKFTEARELFRCASGYKDSQHLLGDCDFWIAFLELVSKREFDDAASMLKWRSKVGDAAVVQRWQNWFSTIRRCIEVLEQIGQGSRLADLNVPWEGGKSPYVVLKLSPADDIQKIEQASFDIQAKPRGMQNEERNAWDALRLPERHLLVDFGTYQVADHNRARRLVEELVAVDSPLFTPPPSAQGGQTEPDRTESDVAQQIAERLGDDGPVFLCFMKLHDAAVERLERAARAAPENPRLLHHLGLVAASKIYSARQKGADLTGFWERLIYAWGAIFADEKDKRFWHQWWSDRQRVYPVTRAQISRAHERIQRFWLDEVRAKEPAENRYDLLLQTEIDAALAVEQGSGIPLGGGRRIVVGPTGATALLLQDAVAAWIETFHPDCTAEDGWQRQVYLYFSDLAPAVTLIKLERYQDAINEIEALNFGKPNPTFAKTSTPISRFFDEAKELEAQARRLLVINLLNKNPPAIEPAIAGWRSALAAAQQPGTDAELSAELERHVVARANQLKSDEDAVDKLERLNNAVDLLEAVRDSGLGGEPSTDALVDALVDRSVLIFNEDEDYAQSRHDAVLAWNIAETPRALQTLYAATVRLARQQYWGGRRQEARQLLEESDELYGYGTEALPGTTGMDFWHREADSLREFLINGLDPASEVSDPYAEALLKRSAGDYGGAIAILKKEVSGHPDDPQIRARLVDYYRDWVWDLRSRQAPAMEIDNLIREALKCCPGFMELSQREKQQ
jgi:TolA-binding protein